jgi:hypothetical protein
MVCVKITLLKSSVTVQVGCSVYGYYAELALMLIAVAIENVVPITVLVIHFLLFFKFSVFTRTLHTLSF